MGWKWAEGGEVAVDQSGWCGEEQDEPWSTNIGRTVRRLSSRVTDEHVRDVQRGPEKEEGKSQWLWSLSASASSSSFCLVREERLAAPGAWKRWSGMSNTSIA